jgi:predicted nucleic acid-binding protein
VLEVIRGVKEYQLSFWDAQIWATAKLNQISVIYSEDFNVGAIIEGVRFVNLLQVSN